MGWGGGHIFQLRFCRVLLFFFFVQFAVMVWWSSNNCGVLTFDPAKHTKTGTEKETEEGYQSGY